MTGILNLPGLRELDRKELENEYRVKVESKLLFTVSHQ
jgi:hypothetical protein